MRLIKLVLWIIYWILFGIIGLPFWLVIRYWNKQGDRKRLGRMEKLLIKSAPSASRRAPRRFQLK